MVLGHRSVRVKVEEASPSGKSCTCSSTGRATFLAETRKILRAGLETADSVTSDGGMEVLNSEL